MSTTGVNSHLSNIPLTVDNSHLEQNIETSSFKIDDKAVRDNEEDESGICMFEVLEGSEWIVYDENGSF